MKKLLILIIPILLCGCSKNITLNINNSNISNIIYDNTVILNNDYETIINQINNKTFYELFDNNISGTKLEIETNEYFYNFELVSNFLIYTVDNNRYFTSTDNLNDYLKKTVNKYNDDNFFTVEIINNYDINNSDYLITVDNSSTYIILYSNLNIHDLQVKKINSDYVNSNLYNTINSIESNKTICININNPNDILITFLTPYNYEVNITYNDGFIKKIESKN